MFAATSTLNAQDATVSRRDLVDGGWRLAGMIFAAMPAGGYPITFLDDSSLISGNFRGATRWSLTDNELRLLGSSGTVYYRFDWMPRARVFRECSKSGIPGMVIFRYEPRTSDFLSGQCEVGPPQPLRTFGVSCRLEVVPAQAARNEPVEFRYVISAPDSQRISGRYLRSDEETFGRSIRLRSEAGEEYRFLRTPRLPYSNFLESDTGVVTPGTYRFRFPPRSSDNARLAPAREWGRGWVAVDSASRAARDRVFAEGARTISPGTYVVSADISYQVFWTHDRTKNGLLYPDADALPCTPARLVVSP